jgi:ssDNA-binding Zn-finger/Zn-ribbon topoisomerase 1
MIDVDKFKDSLGKVDWKALREAEVAAGEHCRECGWLIYPPKGRPSLCHKCRDLREDKGEVDHQSRLRCPKCRHLWNVDREDGDIHSEGSHEVCCPECEHEFEVVTNVSYSWESPKLIEEESEIHAATQT